MWIRVTKYFFIFFLVGCSSGNDDDINPQVPTGETQADWPYFWQVEKDGKTSYILGAIHITVSLDELPCADNIKSHLKNSNLVFSEYSNTWTNILKKEKPEETDVELNHLYTQNGFDLIYSESEDDFYFKQLSLEAQNFFNERGVSNKLSFTGYMRARTFLCFREAYGHSVVQKSLEKEIIKMAKSENIPIKPLDTFELREKVSSSFDTLDAVESAVKSFSKCPENVAQLSYKYKSGDIPQFDFSDDFIQLALKDRNQEWLTKFMSAYENYDSVFIVAGVSHFIDPANLLGMLSSEGFAIYSLCTVDGMPTNIYEETEASFE